MVRGTKNWEKRERQTAEKELPRCFRKSQNMDSQERSVELITKKLVKTLKGTD